MDISLYLLIGSSLLLLSVILSKISDRYGIPTLLIFLIIGMIIGSDALNWIYFDDYQLAQSIGLIALAFILFSGGLDTDWHKVKPVVKPALVMATLGVLISTVILGFFASWILDFSITQGLLLGAIVSSTDAAAVFSVLRSKAIGFKYHLKELMEFESATNDPMAIFLTIGMIQFLTLPEFDVLSLLWLFVTQMLIGLIAGYLFGKLATLIINKVNLGYDGLYPVLTLSFVPLIFFTTNELGGSGVLATYLAGLVLGNASFIHKRSLISFFDGVGWLMQIMMFLTLGLLIFPSRVIAIAGPALLITLALMFVARPVSIFISMIFTKFQTRAKLMVSWTGLRGAVPIILATFPLSAGLPNADLIFSIIFFVVVASVLFQGPTLPAVARLLHVNSPIKPKTRFPIEFEPSVDTKGAMKEVEVEEGDSVVGKKIVELNLPEKALIVIINREGKFLVPRGNTKIKVNDKLLLLAQKERMAKLYRILKE